MAKTSFNISFIESTNCNSIAFNDLSYYNEDVAVKTPIVKVKYPDFNQILELTYTPRSMNTIEVLPIDGLYTIELSVCPNDKLKKVFYYVKLCNWKEWLRQELTKVSNNKTKVIALINLYKYAVAINEVVLEDPKKAILMYNYLKSQTC